MGEIIEILTEALKHNMVHHNSSIVSIDFNNLLSSWMELSTEQHYRDALSRFKLLPKQIEEIIQLLTEALKHNMVHHNSSIVSINFDTAFFVVGLDLFVGSTFRDSTTCKVNDHKKLLLFSSLYIIFNPFVKLFFFGV